jgi:hypothetical protein
MYAIKTGVMIAGQLILKRERGGNALVLMKL